MIIVHDTFVCKPGNASKLAKKFKEAMTGNNELVHVMTDMTGPFNRVIMGNSFGKKFYAFFCIGLMGFSYRPEIYFHDLIWYARC